MVKIPETKVEIEFVFVLADAKREYDELLARRKEIDERGKEIDERMQMIEGAIRYLEELMHKNEPRLESPRWKSAVAETERFKGKSAVQAAEIVLKDNGKPMHMNLIVEQVLKGGYDGQKNPKKVYSNLFTTLSRKAESGKVFVKGKKPATFGLLEWEQPKLGVI